MSLAAAETKLVIFDCDGVLVDSEPISLSVLVDLLARAGLELDLDDAYELFLGKSLKSISGILNENYGLLVDTAFLEGMRGELYDRFRRELKPVEGIAEALDGLKMARCVASSSQLERIRLSLSLTGLIGRLEPNIFSASMVTRGKPAPDLFLHAAGAMGIAAEHCVVIEDSPAGVLAAKAAGMRVFAFTGASHARNPRHIEKLSQLQPDLLFDDMRELIQFVGEENADRKSH